VNPAASELPNQPSVNGAKGQMSLRCQTPSARHMIKQPRNFDGRKIGTGNSGPVTLDLCDLFKRMVEREGDKVL